MLGAWGHHNPRDYVLVDRFLDHVYVFGVVAVLMVGAALALLTHRRWLQGLLAVGAALAAALWALVGTFIAPLFGAGDVEATAAVPNGDYTAVVRLSYLNAPDPAWIVSVRQTGSLTAREFDVGCIDGDDPQYTFREIRWADPEHLIVRVADHTSTVTVEETSGLPRPVSGRVWNC